MPRSSLLVPHTNDDITISSSSSSSITNYCQLSVTLMNDVLCDIVVLVLLVFIKPYIFTP